MTHGYQFQATRRAADLTSTLLRVSNEPVLLVGVVPVLLAEPNVVPGSIVVLDAVTAREYRLDVDYEVLPAGNRVQIARLPGSNIPDPGSVLVSYQYDLGEDPDLTSLDHRYTGRLETTFSRYLTLYGDLTERWNDRRAARGNDHERYEVLAGGAMAHFYGFSVSGEARRSRTLTFRSTEYLANAAYQASLGPLSPVVGFRLIAQQFHSQGEERVVYEAYTEENVTLPLGLGVVWHLRFFDERGGSSSGKFVDGTVALKYVYKGITLKADYRVDASYRSTQRYENHRVFVSAGRSF
jgi:hypothetical protein